jgi:hypothetical protein
MFIVYIYIFEIINKFKLPKNHSNSLKISTSFMRKASDVCVSFTKCEHECVNTHCFQTLIIISTESKY